MKTHTGRPPLSAMALAFLLLLGAFVLGACGSSGETSGETASTAAGGSAGGGVKTYIDLAQVSVYKLSVAIDSSMMPQIKTEVEAVLASLESQAADMKTVESLSETTVGGMTGYKATYSFSKSGAPVTSTLYFLFNGSLEYQLTLQAADENWEAKKPAFATLVASFKPRPTD